MRLINFNNVWEKYRVKFIQQKKVLWEEVWALQGVSFEAQEGDIVGIIGKNGAGKTTLLKLIAGMLVPDKGEIEIKGRVSALMALGAGFNPEFTGIENIKLNAAIYGLANFELKQRISDIVEFADLGKFIDAPIKYYSQGMYMRLAFALAIFTQPDILLLDDILSVGDEEAQQKCIKKVFDLKQKGKTIILVSHDMSMVSKLCNKIILLEKGRIVRKGLPSKVIPYYLETVGEKTGIAVLEKESLRIIFNNGKLAINYGGSLLTKEAGGHILFFMPSVDSWVPSFNLSWHMRNGEADKIIVEGRTHEGTPLLLLTFQIEEDSFKWEVEVKGEDIRQSHVALFLVPQYAKWHTLDKDSDFPLFISKSNLHDLGLNNCPNGMLGLSGTWQNKECPGLIIEHKKKDALIKPLNGGYEQEARVVQWALDSNSKNSVSIKIFPLREVFEEYIKDAKKEFQEQEKKFLKQKEEAELARLYDLCTISSGNIRLFIDIENKAIRFYYKNLEITKSSGLHSSFLLDDKWQDFSSAEWKIEKNSDSLNLYLCWQQPKFTQTWRLSIQEDSVSWQVECGYDRHLKYKQLKFGLFINPEYTDFFCGHQQESFPDNFTIWHDLLLENANAKIFGVRKVKSLPEILFENNQGSLCVIQNTDKENSCRVLQLSLLQKHILQGKAAFSTRMRLIADEGFVNKYIEQEEKLLKQKEEAELARLRDLSTISSGNIRLFIDIENKAIRFYYKNLEITSKRGIYFIFEVSKEDYDFNMCTWSIDKVAQNKIILNVYYESTSLLQVWNLTCQEDNSLTIKIEIESKEKISFANQDIKIEVSDIFDSWETAHEKGDFNISDYTGNISPVALKNNKISQILLNFKERLKCEQLFFAVFSDAEEQTVDISKIREAGKEYICINTPLMLSTNRDLTRPGKYTCFDGKLSIGNSFQLKENANPLKAVEVVKKEAKIIFDSGKGIIFFRGSELTTGLSLYSSMRSAGIWHDSYQAKWKMKHKDSRSFTAVGDWPHIPISQTWKIELSDENVILWDIRMTIHRAIKLNLEQSNIMLCPKYKTWIVSNYGRGIFLDEYTQRYDILPFRFWYGKAREITAQAESHALPEVYFRNDTDREDMRAIVENTDTLYRARLIQYQKENIASLLPGEYTYFKGIIKIGSRT